MKKGIYFGIVIGVMVLIFTYSVSASFSDWVKGITGRVTSGGSNATITLSGSNPVSVRVWNFTVVGVQPTESTTTRVLVNITVSDPDGAADINDSSVAINVTRLAEVVKTNYSCSYLGLQTTTSRNYTCTFYMWYFDEAGTWNITAVANDFGTHTYVSNITTFQYGLVDGAALGPVSLTWPGVSQGQGNQTSNNDPIVVNNTANNVYSNVTITGINLVGADPSYIIDARNITVDNETGGSGCSGAGCNECAVYPTGASGTRLINATERQIVNSTLGRGNYSVNNFGTGQEQLYFCMPEVPSNIISQTYATPQSWTFTFR